MTKGLLLYSCLTHREDIELACRRQLAKARPAGSELGFVTLKRAVDFGDWNLVIQRERGRETMHYQILAGLERLSTDLVFFCESDVLYHPSHFDFVPPDLAQPWFNEHTWRLNAENGQALFYWTKQLSGCCMARELAVEHYRKRIARIEQDGKYTRTIGFEPGCHQAPQGVDHLVAQRWMSWFPNVDVRHDGTQTRNRWSQEQFRNPKNCEGWTMADAIPGWGRTQGRFQEFLADVGRD